MSGTLTLSYVDLRNAILERRFPPNSPTAQWLAAAYSDVWNAAEWQFKHVADATFYTSVDGLSNGAAAQQPKMPAAFANTISLYDDLGSELKWMTERDFRRCYQPYTATGRPEAFTVINRQVWLGPTPTSAFAFRLSYKRRLATRLANGTVQAGFFINDDDIPLWDDHHYLLVLRAKLIGLRDRSDPTATDLEGEYVRLLQAMKDEYVEQSPLGRQMPAWR